MIYKYVTMATLESTQMSTESVKETTESVKDTPEIIQTSEITPHIYQTEISTESVKEDEPEIENSESDIDILGTSISKTKIEWHEFPKSIKVNIIGQESYILSVGDFITFEGRNDTGVIIVKIYGYEEESGPRCMTYLPWRDETGRWATRVFSLRGDPRSIICYPEGMRHHGQHINWATIKNMNHMAPISNPEFQNKLHSLRNPDSAH
jgi:hypothetical protein